MAYCFFTVFESDVCRLARKLNITLNLFISCASLPWADWTNIVPELHYFPQPISKELFWFVRHRKRKGLLLALSRVITKESASSKTELGLAQSVSVWPSVWQVPSSIPSGCDVKSLFRLLYFLCRFKVAPSLILEHFAVTNCPSYLSHFWSDGCETLQRTTDIIRQ